MVERIREIGADPALQDEALRQLLASTRERRPQLEAERQRIQLELLHKQEEANRLAAAIGEGRRGEGGLSGKLAEAEVQVTAMAARMDAVREELLAIDAELLDERDLRDALAAFDPVWSHLTPAEQARTMRLLVDRVAYDGAAGTVAIMFRAPAHTTKTGAQQ